MRQYEPPWIELKKSNLPLKQIRISAPAKYHPRIYKAIIKEKDMDVVYKLELSDRGLRAKLSRNSQGALLIIRMHICSNYSIGLSDF